MPIYIFLEAWICCALVLSNLTHSMNLYLEAITSVLSHWFVMLEARSSQTAPFWFTLSLASCSAPPYQLGTWPAPPTAVPWQSQSFCIHQLDCSALSVFHCPGQVQLRAFSSSRCPLKLHSPLFPQWEHCFVSGNSFGCITLNFLQTLGWQSLPEGEPDLWRQQAMIPVLCSLTTNPPVFHIPASIKRLVMDLYRFL